MYRRTLKLPRRLTGIIHASSAVTCSPAVSAIPESKPVEQPLTVPPAADFRAVNSMLDSLAALIGKAKQQRSRTATEIAQQSVELGVAIAERLLGAAIALDRQRLDRMVAASLERLPATDSCVVRAHPDDVVLLRGQIDANAACEKWRESLVLQPDETCERGRLILEAGDLFVDWDTQRGLAEMRTLLLDEILTEA